MQLRQTAKTRRGVLGLASGILCVVCAGAPRVATAGENTWTAIGPDGGPVYDADFSGRTQGDVYIVARSGFHRSTLAAASWELTKADFGDVPLDLAVDPTNGDRVLLAAANGLFVSADRGSTFTLRLSAEHGFRVAISGDGSTAYFAAGRRIFRSQNRGDSWEERTPAPGDPASQPVHALAVDPMAAGTVYASVLGYDVFASHDGGATWQQLGGAGGPLISQTRSLLVDPSNPQRVLAAGDYGLFISDDRGLTWAGTSITDSVSDVDVDPTNSMVIYVAHSDTRITKSTNGGVSWTVLPVEPRGPVVPKVVIDPKQPSNLLVLGGDGVSISTDSGATWVQRTAGLKTTSPSAFAPAPASGRNYFGVPGSGVHYVEAGASVTHAVNNVALAQLQTQPITIMPITSVQVLAQPGAADVLYANLDGHVIGKSVNAGADWSSVWPFPQAAVFSVAGSAAAPQAIFAATTRGFYRSLDGGAAWATSNTGLPAGVLGPPSNTVPPVVEAVAVASPPSILYASAFNPAALPSFEHHIYKSVNAGASWSAASAADPLAPLSLTVHPQDSQVVYVGTRAGQLRKTTDGGASWTAVNDATGAPLCCGFVGVSFDPVNPRVVYAAHATGVLRSVDAGATWETLTANSPGMHFSPVSVGFDATNPSTLLLAVAGFGVMQMTLAPNLELTMSAPAALTTSVSGAYTLNVRNHGPFHATNVRVRVELPASASAISAVTTEGTCVLADTTVTCTYDVLRSGANPAVISLVTAPTAAGSFRVAASIAGDQPDPMSLDNTPTSMVTVAGNPARQSGGGGGVSLELLALLLALLPVDRRARRQR